MVFLCVPRINVILRGAQQSEALRLAVSHATSIPIESQLPWRSRPQHVRWLQILQPSFLQLRTVHLWMRPSQRTKNQPFVVRCQVRVRVTPLLAVVHRAADADSLAAANTLAAAGAVCIPGYSKSVGRWGVSDCSNVETIWLSGLGRKCLD